MPSNRDVSESELIPADSPATILSRAATAGNDLLTGSFTPAGGQCAPAGGDNLLPDILVESPVIIALQQ